MLPNPTTRQRMTVPFVWRLHRPVTPIVVRVCGTIAMREVGAATMTILRWQWYRPVQWFAKWIVVGVVGDGDAVVDATLRALRNVDFPTSQRMTRTSMGASPLPRTTQTTNTESRTCSLHWAFHCQISHRRGASNSTRSLTRQTDLPAALAVLRKHLGPQCLFGRCNYFWFVGSWRLWDRSRTVSFLATILHREIGTKRIGVDVIDPQKSKHHGLEG